MAEKQDIRENTMSGGTPARLRGLAANGNSISPTLEEVMNAMGITKQIMEFLACLTLILLIIHPFHQILFLAYTQIIEQNI